jgi:hypothetical protein
MERVLGIRQCISNLHWLSLQRHTPQNATPAGLQNKLANNFALTSGNAVCRKGSPDNLDRGVVWVVRDGVGLARTLKRTIQMRRSARTKTDITAMTQSRKKWNPATSCITGDCFLIWPQRSPTRAKP